MAQQQAQIRWLELRVKDLGTQLFGKKSEKRSGSGDDGNLQWDALLGEVRALAPVPAQPPTPGQRRSESGYVLPHNWGLPGLPHKYVTQERWFVEGGRRGGRGQAPLL